MAQDDVFRVALLLGLLSVAPIGLTGVIVVVLLVFRTDTEEQRLIDRFGDDYRLYMAQTGRFIPRLFGNQARHL